MDMYILSTWDNYKSDQGFHDLERLCASFDFSDWFKSRIHEFDTNVWDMPIEDVARIVLELKTKMSIPSKVFAELDIIINLNKPLVHPLYPFPVPGYAIHKDGGQWTLYHIKSGQIVSRMTDRGTGELAVSTKIAVITERGFQSQGLTAELGRLYISEVIPEGGVFEIAAVHPASVAMAKKGGFSINPETNTWILKV